MVATRDIGRAAAAALLDPPARSQIIALAGPVDVSPADVAATLSSILGKPVQVAPVPQAEQETALKATGLPAKSAALYAEMSAAIDSGLAAYDGTEVRKRGTETLPETLGRIAKAA